MRELTIFRSFARANHDGQRDDKADDEGESNRREQRQVSLHARAPSPPSWLPENIINDDDFKTTMKILCVSMKNLRAFKLIGMANVNV